MRVGRLGNRDEVLLRREREHHQPGYVAEQLVHVRPREPPREGGYRESDLHFRLRWPRGPRPGNGPGRHEDVHEHVRRLG